MERTSDIVPASWASWTNLVLGIWLIVAPFALNYGTYRWAMANDIVVGLVAGILALVVALAKSPVGRTRAPG